MSGFIAKEHVYQRSLFGQYRSGGTNGTCRIFSATCDRRCHRSCSVLEERRKRTSDLRLHGWNDWTNGSFQDVYGSDRVKIHALPGSEQSLDAKLPLTEAEVRWDVHCKLARTVEDVLSRRSRALLLDARASIATTRPRPRRKPNATSNSPAATS